MPFHSYIFFDIEASIELLQRTELINAKKAFVAHLAVAAHVRTHTYSTLGFKAGTRFALHINADTPEAIHIFLRDVLYTDLGKHLKITYTLFGMTRPSQYNPAHAPKEVAWDLSHKYLVVYPFTKTTEWHLMPYDERRTIMKAHVDVGRKFSDTIAQRLLYSYGVDDHEFIVSYLMDSLEEFQSLVMAMRETESRRYTKNDLPIYTCIHMPLAEVLDFL